MTDGTAIHQHGSEPAWQRVLRATQSTWREEQGLAPGHRPDGTALGSALSEGDALAGRNFLTPGTWARVQDELAENARATGTDRRVLEPDRLRGNLLSSQPLCFNLFAELDLDRPLAGRVLRLLFPDVVSSVGEICFEWSPGRGDPSYLDNHSAFDVAVFHTRPDGGTGVLGFEVKYHESLGGKPPAVRDRAVEVAARAGITGDASKAPWSTQPVAQLLLDQLLAESITQHPAATYGTGTFALLFPAVNVACHRALAAYAAAGDGRAMRAVTLETFVGALSACTDAPWVAAVRGRYLAYDRAGRLGYGVHR